MNEEVMRIAKLLEEGKLNAEQATALISALKTENELTEGSKPRIDMSERRAFIEKDMTTDQMPGQRMLQVRILSEDGDKVKVNLPLNFVKGILKVTGKLPMIKPDQMEGVDMEALMESINMAIDQDINGRIVDIETGNGDLVIVEIIDAHA